MDPDATARIRAAHTPTITWWGCAVQLTCLSCRTPFPCLALVGLAVQQDLQRRQRRGINGWR